MGKLGLYHVLVFSSVWLGQTFSKVMFHFIFERYFVVGFWILWDSIKEHCDLKHSF